MIATKTMMTSKTKLTHVSAVCMLKVKDLLAHHKLEKM